MRLNLEERLLLLNNNKGFTIVEVLIVMLVIGIFTSIGVVSYAKRNAELNAMRIMIQDITKIFAYYENTDCIPAVPSGYTAKSPYGNSYTVTCGGNNKTVIVSTLIPNNADKMIPEMRNAACFYNGNTLVCYKVRSIKDDGGFEKKYLYLQ